MHALGSPLSLSAAALLLALALLLGACGSSRTCEVQGFERGTPEFDTCVERERAAAYARLQRNRYRPSK